MLRTSGSVRFRANVPKRGSHLHTVRTDGRYGRDPVRHGMAWDGGMGVGVGKPSQARQANPECPPEHNPPTSGWIMYPMGYLLSIGYRADQGLLMF